MLSLETIANVILNNCKDVSNKKIQKLVYYVFAWYLAIFNRQIANIQFEAWEHGPVCRALYNEYRRYGWSAIPQYRGFVLASDEDIKFIQSVLSVYGNYTADELEDMTHEELPWLEARKGFGSNVPSDAVISNNSMWRYYSEQADIKQRIMDAFFAEENS